MVGDEALAPFEIRCLAVMALIPEWHLPSEIAALSRMALAHIPKPSANRKRTTKKATVNPTPTNLLPYLKRWCRRSLVIEEDEDWKIAPGRSHEILSKAVEIGAIVDVMNAWLHVFDYDVSIRATIMARTFLYTQDHQGLLEALELLGDEAGLREGAPPSFVPFEDLAPEEVTDLLPQPLRIPYLDHSFRSALLRGDRLNPA
ncbi:MAG: hypothetical protein AAFN74_27655, partial [Myxococcota bacterium]